jgi:hypothetical protein
MRKYLSILVVDSLLLALILLGETLLAITGRPAKEPSLLMAVSNGALFLMWLWQAWDVWKARKALIAQEREAAAAEAQQ